MSQADRDREPDKMRQIATNSETNRQTESQTKRKEGKGTEEKARKTGKERKKPSAIRITLIIIKTAPSDEGELNNDDYTEKYGKRLASLPADRGDCQCNLN